MDRQVAPRVLRLHTISTEAQVESASPVLQRIRILDGNGTRANVHYPELTQRLHDPVDMDGRKTQVRPQLDLSQWHCEAGAISPDGLSGYEPRPHLQQKQAQTLFCRLSHADDPALQSSLL